MDRTELEEKYGQVWTTTEVQVDFIIHSFLASNVDVTRKVDNAYGSLTFQNSPRFYFDFSPRYKVLW